jgi:hypothetical protein
VTPRSADDCTGLPVKLADSSFTGFFFVLTAPFAGRFFGDDFLGRLFFVVTAPGTQQVVVLEPSVLAQGLGGLIDRGAFHTWKFIRSLGDYPLNFFRLFNRSLFFGHMLLCSLRHDLFFFSHKV